MKKLLAASALVRRFGIRCRCSQPYRSVDDSQQIAGNESDQPCKLGLIDNKLTSSSKSPEGKDLQVTGTLEENKLTFKYESDYNGTLEAGQQARLLVVPYIRFFVLPR